MCVWVGECIEKKGGEKRAIHVNVIFCFRLLRNGELSEKKNYELQGTYRPIKFTNLDVNVTDGAENV